MAANTYRACKVCQARLPLQGRASRCRQFVLCPKHLAEQSACLCGCGRTFPRYNGRGRERQFTNLGCKRRSDVIFREQLRQRRSNGIKKAWASGSFSHLLGPGHHQWKHGRYGSQYGWAWKQARRAALERDHSTCRRCDRTDLPVRQLHVHHLNGNRDDHRLENLLTVCNSCHQLLHPRTTVLACV